MGLLFFDYTERIVHPDPLVEDGSKNTVIITDEGDYIIRDRESCITETFIRMTKSKPGSIIPLPGTNELDLLRVARHRIANQFADGTDQLQSALIYINRAIRAIEKYQDECEENYASRPRIIDNDFDEEERTVTLNFITSDVFDEYDDLSR